MHRIKTPAATPTEIPERIGRCPTLVGMHLKSVSIMLNLLILLPVQAAGPENRTLESAIPDSFDTRYYTAKFAVFEYLLNGPRPLDSSVGHTSSTSRFGLDIPNMSQNHPSTVPDLSAQQSLNPKRKQSNTTRKNVFKGVPAATAGSNGPQQLPKGSNKRKRSNVDPPNTPKPVPDPSRQQSLRQQSNTTQKIVFGGSARSYGWLGQPSAASRGSNKRKRSNVDPPDTLKRPRMALFDVTANNSERKNRGKREVKATARVPFDERPSGGGD